MYNAQLTSPIATSRTPLKRGSQDLPKWDKTTLKTMTKKLTYIRNRKSHRDEKTSPYMVPEIFDHPRNPVPKTDPYWYRRKYNAFLYFPRVIKRTYHIWCDLSRSRVTLTLLEGLPTVVSDFWWNIQISDFYVYQRLQFSAIKCDCQIIRDISNSGVTHATQMWKVLNVKA